MAIKEHIERKQGKLESVCERYGVERIALFGSALREDFDSETSDLDFAVTFASMEAEDRAAAYFGLAEDLEELFGRSVDLTELSAVRNPYLREIIETSQKCIYTAA